MRKYINHVRAKPPHERRQHALQAAVLCTVVVFLGWLGTLGLRLANYGGNNVAQSGQSDQTASAYNATASGGNSLQVATSTSDSSGITLPYSTNQ